MPLPQFVPALLGSLPGRVLRQRLGLREPQSVEDFARTGAPHRLEVLRPSRQALHPLPVNLADAEDLPAGQDYDNPLALRNVPHLPVPGAFLAHLHDCLLVRTRYAWGESQFSLCTPEGRLLQLHGLSSDPRRTDLQAVVRRALRGKPPVLPRATWTLGYWYSNHYHWMVEWLPRILTARASGLPDDSILLPTDLSRPGRDSLELIGLQPHWLDETTEAWRVTELTVVAETGHHGPALAAVAAALRQPITPARPLPAKVWVSRSHAVHRRLLAGAEIEAALASRGWTCVRLETLTLREQIALLSNARALAGVHGAGLTNLLFTPPGTPLLEIGMVERPTAEFYALAATLGHPFWYVPSQRARHHESLIHDDVVLDPQSLLSVIDALDSTLDRPAPPAQAPLPVR
jgi:capsular polysaccharide biosynthesis protein